MKSKKENLMILDHCSTLGLIAPGMNYVWLAFRTQDWIRTSSAEHIEVTGRGLAYGRVALPLFHLLEPGNIQKEPATATRLFQASLRSCQQQASCQAIRISRGATIKYIVNYTCPPFDAKIKIIGWVPKPRKPIEKKEGGCDLWVGT